MFPKAFQSIKFFLRTHSPDFQEKQRIEVQVDHNETIRLIREHLYGLPGAADAGGLPILDVEEAEGVEAAASGASAPLLPAAAGKSQPLDLSGVVGADREAAQAARMEPEKATTPRREPWD